MQQSLFSTGNKLKNLFSTERVKNEKYRKPSSGGKVNRMMGADLMSKSHIRYHNEIANVSQIVNE